MQRFLIMWKTTCGEVNIRQAKRNALKWVSFVQLIWNEVLIENSRFPQFFESKDVHNLMKNMSTKKPCENREKEQLGSSKEV